MKRVSFYLSVLLLTFFISTCSDDQPTVNPTPEVPEQPEPEPTPEPDEEQGIDGDSLVEYIEQTAQLLNEAQSLNFKRWDILNQRVHENPQAAGSYEGELEVLKNYISKRVPKLDTLIGQ